MRDNSRDKFCSSCAVEFAGQGIPIQEIAESSSRIYSFKKGDNF